MARNRPIKYWLRASDKQELIEYRPRLARLYGAAKERKAPWARCYREELRMIDRALVSGRL